MQYTKLTRPRQDKLMRALADMPTFLRDAFEQLSPEAACRPGPNGTFSPIEHIWHLADLEREGFGLRIHRLHTEDNPQLSDFDGPKVAVERDYKSKSLEAGLAAFEAVREANISRLKSLSPEAWLRTGMQDGIGSLSLGDIPGLMRQHDQAHILEITDWLRTSRRSARVGCVLSLFVVIVYGALHSLFMFWYGLGGGELLLPKIDPSLAFLSNIVGYLVIVFLALHVVLAPFGRSIRTLGQVLICLPWLLLLFMVLLSPHQGGEVFVGSFSMLVAILLMQIPGEKLSKWLSGGSRREYW